MSPDGSRFLVTCGLFLFGIILLANGAAIQGPGSMQMQKNSSDFQRDSSPRPADPRFPISMSPDHQFRDSSVPPPPPSVPFGINSPPPGFTFQSGRPMAEPPRMMMMMPPQFSPNMNGPQQPKREAPVVNSTTNIPAQMNNISRANNNTRRETEQTTTTIKPNTVTTHNAFQELPLGNDPKELDGSKKQMPPPFSVPVGQPMPLNPFFQPNPFFQSNPQIVFDQMGRPFMLVPVGSSFPMLQHHAGPQGPPVPMGPFPAKPVGPVQFVVQPGDFGKQPPPTTPHTTSDKNKDTTTSN